MPRDPGCCKERAGDRQSRGELDVEVHRQPEGDRAAGIHPRRTAPFGGPRPAAAEAPASLSRGVCAESQAEAGRHGARDREHRQAARCRCRRVCGQGACRGHGGKAHAAGCCDTNAKPRWHDTSRIAWAKLMARVGEAFPLECPACGGDIRLIALVSQPRTPAGREVKPTPPGGRTRRDSALTAEHGHSRGRAAVPGAADRDRKRRTRDSRAARQPGDR